jgi:hypothetical protein
MQFYMLNYTTDNWQLQLQMHIAQQKVTVIQQNVTQPRECRVLADNKTYIHTLRYDSIIS